MYRKTVELKNRWGSCVKSKMFLIMKLSFLLCLVTLLHASAATFSQRINLHKRGYSLKETLNEIHKQSGYSFLYDAIMLRSASPVTVDLKNVSLKEALEACFINQPFTYTINRNTIVVTPKTEASIEKAVIDQSVIVKGKVTNSNGDPLSGVSVIIKGTKQGAITDELGNYSVRLPDMDGTLVYSFIGYIQQEVKVGDKDVINITLQDKAPTENEIVIVGYGTQQRKDVTGAVSVIDEKALKEVPVSTPQQMLQGRVAGVYVTQGDNRPGAAPSVLIRGQRSISGGNDPLYVIDGIPTTDGLSDINPSDIKSMVVLKDASATAIYGSRGANGVILITTARGTYNKNGEPEVHYDTYFGVKKISRYAKNFNGPDFVRFVRDAYEATGNYDPSDPAASDAKIFDPASLEAIQNNQFTDWQREITRDGFTQNHKLSILGASKTTRYNISLGYYNDIGQIKLQDYKRYSLRANLDQEIGKSVKMGLSMLGSFNIQNGADFNPYYGAVIQSPVGNAYDKDGNIIAFPNGDALMYNPLTNFIPGNLIDKTKRTRILASLYGEIKLADGLKYRVNFGPDITNSRSGDYAASLTTSQQGQLPKASNSDQFIFSYTLENLLTYNKTFGKHHLDLTGLYSVQQREDESTSAGVKDLPVGSVTYYNLGSANTITGVGSGYSKWDILSYMARANYGFDNRFLVTLTAREDGSSRFAPGHQWGFFPSAAFAYNIYNEHFLKNASYLSNLKIRLSYGRTGNTALSPYGTQGLLSRTAYTFNDESAFGYMPGSIANPNLKWETTESYNAGIDFGFFQERLTGSLEAYRSHTFDLLLPFVLPTSTGFSTVTTNIGSTRNTGFEMSLSSVNILSKREKGFQWTTDLTAAFNKEEILELSAGKVDDVADARFIGEAVQVFYDYQKIGIWQNGQDEQAAKFSSSVGQIKIADRNGNGKIDPEDRMILGQKHPKWTFGLNNRFSFKNIDLGIFIVGQTGNLIADYFRTVPNNSIALGGRYNMIDVDYWTPENPTNAYPQPLSGQSGSPGPIYGSTLKYFSGSFLRLKNIDIGYRLPKRIANKMAAKSLRVYFNVTNPYVFSSFVHKYDGIDPENTSEPAIINYQLGLNVTF